ncbi:D-alanine--D-alanine ligase [Leptospira ilyithenensis]|uniref:D-alanine--D-alanine ligase n=1 Tax=Leptospira ilyithenensis TaxID=2484901 RepID=A0A4R9LQG6_9LEPT|nr:D-alanine--D-alanine ligase [Leptospira ilyithenensis]TGN08441.1 D-alanine--D-alanine ligase [Leptospira ilyithenensis]
MKRIKLGLIFGGTSSEHEISIRSSYFIFKTLDRTKFEVNPIFIDQGGVWKIPKDFEGYYPNPENISPSDFAVGFQEKNELYANSDKHLLKSTGVEVVFIGLHGGSGEDGRIQGFLDVMGIPYTGSGVLASALAMDKFRSNQLFEKAGIPVAPFLEVSKKDIDAKRFVLQMPISFPVFIKPTLGGSSVNAGPAKTPEEAILLIEKIFVSEDRVFIQELITGTEVSIGVLEKKANEDWESFPLVATEIRPKTEFFDFTAKYTKGASEEITPAEIPMETMDKLKSYTLICHKTLGCKGYSRTDFIIRNGIPYVLETNTLPGMTGTSLIPQQAKALGIDMKEVFNWLVDLALSS